MDLQTPTGEIRITIKEEEESKTEVEAKEDLTTIYQCAKCVAKLDTLLPFATSGMTTITWVQFQILLTQIMVL